jgi:uncharacterized protein (TIGR00255 family)
MNKYNIKSMTGFGKTLYETKGKKISVEIKSLNSKQLDINTRLTNSFRAKEMEIRRILAEKLERGKVDICINIENSGEVSTYSLNKELAKKHYRELKSITQELKIKDTDFMQLLIRMPDAMSSKNDELDDAEWKKLELSINKTLKLVDEFRLHEGKVLEEDFLKRINLINKLLEEIKKIDKVRIDNIRLKIKKGLKEFITEINIDQNRFEQELIYYIEKIDITEEILRLKKHCDYFIETMKESCAGKKLSFIGQEIGREINTMGSKANDADMQKIVVRMKDELEKIKEQLMNIL